ncbi:MAG TPA: poly-gamma-glutamate synthase PgsB [Myxococcota bacterium]|nr:poly-gamma-glutamate synthase PgsB [Myxococcota bacterium]
MFGAELIALTTLGLVGLGVVETWGHRRRLAGLPVRVHVNGTRGKSSLTRLVAAGLRQAGRPTCAKTTGTLPRMITPDGREIPVFRPSRPNVSEQVRVVEVARSLGAEALVIECMALQPSLQWLCEDKLVRATHAVITNARPDHLDVMGPGADDVAWALCGMIPPRGRVFTAEVERLPILAAACRDRHATLVACTPEDVAAVTDKDLGRFGYTEHAENVALALKVLGDLGVRRDVALAGMWNVQPDPGALTTYVLDFFGRRVVFVNGFAANDPVSTEHIWRTMTGRYADCQKRIALFNCRADRPERSVQLGHTYVAWPEADHVVLMGSGAYLFARAAVKAGLDGSRLVFVEGQRVEEIFEVLLNLVDTSAMIMGLGNIGGLGLDLVRYFRNRSHPSGVIG